MRTIKDPEFNHIKKLLESSNQDDVLIGLELLKKEDFSREELNNSFPAYSKPGWDFYNNSGLQGWHGQGDQILVLNDMWVFHPKVVTAAHYKENYKEL